MFKTKRYKSTYTAFNYLITNDCVNDVERLLKKERHIKDYRKMLDYLKHLVGQITLLPLKVPMNLFLIDCSKINQVNFDFS